MLLERIRRETQHIHRLLERDLDPVGTCSTAADYVALLARFYGFLHPWQHALHSRFPALMPDPERVARLHRDLLWFGQSDLARIPLCASMPPLATHSQALGSLYVVEGSALGGQVMARHFRQLLQLETDGCSYFEGDGPGTGRRWRNFLSLLEAQPRDEHDAIAASAVATFEAMHGWLCAGVAA